MNKEDRKIMKEILSRFSELWDLYPTIRSDYLSLGDKADDNIELFIYNSNDYDDLSDRMDEIFETYYKTPKDKNGFYTVPTDDIQYFFSKYFGGYWYDDFEEETKCTTNQFLWVVFVTTSK